MKKHELKQIRDIAVKLPPVYEQHASGGELGKDETGKEIFKPNVYVVQVNHERRLKNAYKSSGIDGIKAYLDSIQKIQSKRNENYRKDQPAEQPTDIPDVPTITDIPELGDPSGEPGKVD